MTSTSFHVIITTATLILMNAPIAILQDPLPSPFEIIPGTWMFMESERNLPRFSNCRNSSFDLVHNQSLTFSFPNVVADELGNEGQWTFAGFSSLETVIASRKFLGWLPPWNYTYANYTANLTGGFSYDAYARDWSCFIAVKISSDARNTESIPKRQVTTPSKEQNHIADQEMITAASPEEAVLRRNMRQSAWIAEAYQRTHGVAKKTSLAGAVGYVNDSLPSGFHAYFEKSRKAKASSPVGGHADNLPNEFDWRNVNGRSFVSPVRNQGDVCGSCYIFSSLGMLESRIRIATKNLIQPRDVSGCDGGWPLHVHGKYAESFGVVEEAVNPYTGNESDYCTTPATARRYYASGYRYIGGFLGASSAEMMMTAIYNRGPITVAIDSASCQDLAYYRAGIYQRTGVKTNADLFPHDMVNHAVLLVGWGFNETTNVPYWIVKNSFGTSWGEDGYFRIRRGVDECSVESMPSEATPLTTY